MNDTLLREFISLVVEKVKSQRGKHARGGGHFDLKQFKTLESATIMLNYAERYLKEMGRGSSRAAFVLTNRYVLKIALNAKGIAQNETEVDVFTNPKTRPVIARIMDADNRGRWLVSELVRPLKNDDEFQRLTSISLEDVRKTVSNAYRGLPVPENLSDDPFVRALVVTMKETQLMPGDLAKIESWGQSADGRAVLLDYGFTGEVWNRHYSPDAKKPAGAEQATVATRNLRAA